MLSKPDFMNACKKAVELYDGDDATSVLEYVNATMRELLDAVPPDTVLAIEAVTPIVKRYGVRPVLNAIADTLAALAQIEPKDIGWESPTDTMAPEDMLTAARSLRGNQF